MALAATWARLLSRFSVSGPASSEKPALAKPLPKLAPWSSLLTPPTTPWATILAVRPMVVSLPPLLAHSAALKYEPTA
jgi:hypothetical protein